MSRRKRSKLQDLTGQVGEEDGADPRKFFDRRSRARVDRKAYQLCRQVAETLNYVLSGDTGDDVLRGLYVESVDPAPDASRLLVSVAPLDRSDQTPPEDYLARLVAAGGKLRSEVAASISRRKTPELTFRIVSPEDLWQAAEDDRAEFSLDEESE